MKMCYFSKRAAAVSRGIKWFGLVCSSIALSCLPAHAQATYTAASCNPNDIQTAINSEQAHPADGDIIAIPAGACTWTGAGNVISFTTNNTVTIQGAGAMAPTGSGGTTPTGTDQTAITDQLSNTSELFSLTENAPGKLLRFTGIAILQNGSSNVAQFGLISVGGPNNSIRVDHCHFYLTVSGGSSVYVGQGNTTGVADHNYLQSVSNADMDTFDVYNGVGWGGLNDSPNAGGQQIQGNASWRAADGFGTSGFFFIEDSYFSYGWFGNCVVGGRWVFRHNTGVNVNGTAEHGTTFYERSCRAAEFYDNNLTGAPQSGNGNSVYSNNGGTTLWWGNTVASGYPNAVTLDVPRKNNAYSGCCTVPPSGWGYCGTNFNGTGSPWDGNSNTATGYPCLDGPGRGMGDSIGNPPGTSTGNFPLCNITQGCSTNNGQWPRQAIVPIYVWANTYTSGSTTLVNDNSGMLTANQDYYTDSVGSSFNGTAGIGTGTLLPTNASAYTNAPNCMTNPNGGTLYNTGGVPGVGYWYTGGSSPALYVCTAANTWTLYYTPYTYPHPLTTGGPPPVNPPSPPTNLTATVQ